MMGTQKHAPRITDRSWGRLDIEGLGSLKDAKLYPGGARSWDWRETGTQHDPGIQPADVAELLDHGAAVIVLSTGVFQRLGVCPETLRLLKTRGAQYHVLPTPEAVAAYNRLADSHTAVGALIHSTC